MDISVIVPIYGVEQRVGRMLESLFTQTKCNGVEFILVNDCTQDRSMHIARELIAEYPHLEVKIVEHARNMGLARARLSGLEIAQGRYVQHIDSDDWCEATMLEELFEYAEANGADVVNCDFYKEYGHISKYVKHPIPTDREMAFRGVLQGTLMHPLWIKFVRRSIYAQNNITVLSPQMCQWEDLMFTLQIYHYSRKLCYLPKAFVHYHYNANSITQNVTRRNLTDSLNLLLEIDDFFDSKVTLDCRQERQLRSLIIYLYLISHTKGEERRAYAERITPQQRRLIISHQGLSLHGKVILYFASCGMLVVVDLILRLIAMLKRIQRALY